MKRVFIDGSAGTTGLRIRERLAGRNDISLLALPEDRRRDEAARRTAINDADIVFLCLPDDAAREALAMVEAPAVTIIDASSAHRTAPEFAYGFPELSAEFEERIRKSSRISVPGCHASGFIALVHPLVRCGLLPSAARLTCHSVTGYSGGGKKMIAEYEAADPSPLLLAPRQYGLTQEHKHLREMKAVTGLETAPVFCPIVSNFYSGMVVTVPLFREEIAGNAADIRKIYQQLYTGPIVRYREAPDEAGFLSAAALSGRDGMEISVLGNDERILLAARYDNLGKGASGAAVECLNLVMGADKTTGLLL